MKVLKFLPGMMPMIMFLAIWATEGLALPVISQTGNLLANGNFESGTVTLVNGTGPAAFTSWDQWQRPWDVTDYSNPKTRQASCPLIDGNYSAYVSGNIADGIYQYNPEWAAGPYTLSGWLYVLSGQADLSINWKGGGASASSSRTQTLNEWIFLEVTVDTLIGGFQYNHYQVPFPSEPTPGEAVPMVSVRSNSADFFVDGLWFNEGSISTSPFMPAAGFIPSDPISVPEPETILLLGFGLLWIGIGGAWKKLKHHMHPASLQEKDPPVPAL